MNLIDYFDAGASSHPNAPCFVDCGSSAPVATYAQTQAKTCQMARGLQALGLEPGFHGAVLSGNSAAAFTAILAVLRAQGVWLPVSSRNSLESNIEFLQDMDCDMLFYMPRYADLVPAIRAAIPRIRHCIALDDASIAALTEGRSAEMFVTPSRPEAVTAILGTGGTTGRSKGVMLSNRNLMSWFASHMSVMDVQDGMTVLAAAPITHTAGILTFPFLARGGRVVLMDGIDSQYLLRTIEQERVSMLFLPPTVIYNLLAQPNVREFDYSALRYLIYGAAPMSPDKLAEAIEVFGPVMMQIYGQTEVPASITVLRVEDHLVDGKPAPRQRLQSAGRPCTFTRVAIMDDDGKLLREPGATGEIVAQGDIVMPGYYKNPEATAQAQRNGWHCTGDVGYFDAEGFLYIVDRKKDMIITGGFNVYSSVVEAAVMAHPAVKDCAVIGVPDPKWGEAVKAVIELRPGQSVTPEALIQFVKDKLGSVQAPKSVDIVEQLPRSPVGKVLKKEVRKAYWQNQDRMV
ncbi:AMP-binding protein [Hydrogenophaga electricum]|uniref:AMP-dependent acyl-CoA synthetase n=1 Tax=Hydrogenophaga electricum TaxID=1230953 RepID=A0ABQ6C041_9BURK|nr:AMP-binding protein [Hydrogenophaga electricum]GLS13114.1 AMP-dependent acyl-CoA synthetase [Hydrogenophaga electricum]